MFKRDGARAVFAKAEIGTKKMIAIKVPGSLQEFFALSAGVPQPTRFRIRVLARKFGKKFTSNKLSPLVSAPRPPKKEIPTESLPDGDCDGDGAKNKTDGDDDNDGLTDDVELSLSLDPCVADTDKDGLLDKWEFDCDRDGKLNRDVDDDDDDLLIDTLETSIGTDPCNADSDADTVIDGYEYQSAIDLNDDEFQQPNGVLEYPDKRPYPNALFADGEIDYDGDSLTLKEEHDLWVYTYTDTKTHTKTDERDRSRLSYSDGQQYTRSRIIPSGPDAGRHEPTLSRINYDKHEAFKTWASEGYRTVHLASAVTLTGWVNVSGNIWRTAERTDGNTRSIKNNAVLVNEETGTPSTPGTDEWGIPLDGFVYINLGVVDPNSRTITSLRTNPYSLFDMNRDGKEEAAPVVVADVPGDPNDWARDYHRSEQYYFDHNEDRYLSDDERDEDADGLTNYDETHGRMTPGYWSGCYKLEKPFHISIAATSHVDADSDGDDVRDGADDQDNDGVPNVMELSRNASSGLDDQEVGLGCTPRQGLPVSPATWHPNVYGRVNPFNPCLPNRYSRTCPLVVSAALGAPFDGSPNWYSLN